MSADARLMEFRRAVVRLDEAIRAGSDNSLFVDAAIQRFEFCVELAWKSLARVLERDHGIIVASPKPAIQEAYRLMMIDDETVWLSILRDRNLSSHTYREALAREIHGRLPGYHEHLTRLAQKLV